MGRGLITLLAFGRSSPETPLFGDYFCNRVKTLKTIFFEGDSKTTNPVVTKSYEKPKLSSSFFTSATPRPTPLASEVTKGGEG